MRRNVFLFLILTIGLMQTVTAQETVSVSNSPDNPLIVNSRGYLLGPGDEIVVKVLGEKDWDFETALDENGNIEVPFFDKPVPAMCKNERELKAEVTKLLEKYLKTPQVSLRIKERFKSRPPTTIYGAVKSQQQVVLARQYRLSELLAYAGGETDNAGGIVQVVRPQAPLCGSPSEVAEWKAQMADPNSTPMRFYSLSSVKSGNLESNPIIYPGDIIKVEEAKPVYIVGEVSSPQGVYIREEGLTLVEAISKVGGTGREVKVKDINIRRLKPNSKEREVIAVNYELIRKGQAKDPILEPYDIVEVEKPKKPIGQILLEIATSSARTAVQTLATGGPTRILY